MKAPNPTFLDRAENIRNKRRLITLILIAVLAVTVLVVVFVMSVASNQSEYAMMYPDMVGRATGTTTTFTMPAFTTGTTTSETPETSEEEETTTTQLSPSVYSETSDSASDSEESKSADTAPEKLDIEDFRFSSPKTQIASHQLRAVLLDHMKNDIENYIKSVKDSRISFRYLSLKNGEELGINELDPIVPAGSFALPVGIVMNEMALSGSVDPSEVITYEGHKDVTGSYITSNYREGKKIYLGFLEHLMIANNDNVAYEMVLNKLGGLDKIMPRINEISSYQAYDKTVFYTNYAGTDYQGKGRSTCYDMSNYMRFLYRSYTSNPSAYQSLINALAYSEVDSPIRSAFNEDTPILHIYGRNKELCSYTELAIVQMEEPVVVCISVECEDESKVAGAFSEIAGYLSKYITELY